MPIHEFSQTENVALPETAFSAVNVRRRDRQRLLRDNVEVIAPETLCFLRGVWEFADSQHR